jgi:hypothetical protein
MSARVRVAPAHPMDVFVGTLLLLGIGLCIGDEAWGDAGDGVLMFVFFFAWSSARRRAAAFEAAYDRLAGKRRV